MICFFFAEATKSKILQDTKTTSKTYHITPKLAHHEDNTSALAINIFRLEKQTGNIMYRNGRLYITVLTVDIFIYLFIFPTVKSEGLRLEFPFWAEVIQIAAYIFWISNF